MWNMVECGTRVFHIPLTYSHEFICYGLDDSTQKLINVTK